MMKDIKFTRSDWSFMKASTATRFPKRLPNTTLQLTIKEVENLPNSIDMITVSLQDKHTSPTQVATRQEKKTAIFKNAVLQTDIHVKKERTPNGTLRALKERLAKVSISRCCNDDTHSRTPLAKMYVNVIDFLPADEHPATRQVRMHLSNSIRLLGEIQCAHISQQTTQQLKSENDRLSVLLQWARQNRNEHLELIKENKALRHFVKRLQMAVSREPTYEQVVDELCRVREEMAFVNDERQNLLLSLCDREPDILRRKGAFKLCF